MKLRNKNTGKIGRVVIAGDSYLITEDNEENRLIGEYQYLKWLLEDWEDYKESKDYWYIESDGSIIQNHKPTYINHLLDGLKSIGNYFGTLEEAEKAVEELKAWKRLKDKGFRFDGWDENHHNLGIIEFSFDKVENSVWDFKNDLDLLFGGEE